MANILSSEKRAQIVRCLVEGCSIRATSRMTGCCKEAILKLLCSLGPACLKYLSAVPNAFGSEVDYGQVIKIFGQPFEQSRMEARYSPPRCTDIKLNTIHGSPDGDHICTSHNERHNLTMRMQMRRFTRLTNAFSKKMENHAHAVNLHMMHYNFCRIHQTIRCTPAMEAGLADHVWTIDEIVALLS